jgi:hypothetical protein
MAYPRQADSTRIGKDLSSIPPSERDDLLPDGLYLAHIAAAPVMIDDEKGHEFINMKWLIDEKDFVNCRFFDRVYLVGSDKAVDFGVRKLKNIQEAIGGNSAFIEDTEELLDKPCYIRLGQNTRSGYTGQNEVKDYMSIDRYNKYQEAVKARGGAEVKPAAPPVPPKAPAPPPKGPALPGRPAPEQDQDYQDQAEVQAQAEAYAQNQVPKAPPLTRPGKAFSDLSQAK